MSQVRVLGRYALYDEIAHGGMATVHIGRLLGAVGFSRTVAIKCLHPQYAKEPDFVSMFLDEARLAARVRHPNVVGTLDVVATDGELFLVMEYVQGESLSPLMRSLRERQVGIPIPIACAIIADVLEGLHAAHEATSDLGEPLGIVHRDVSPQNILVGTDGVSRVVDFGVAKAAGRVQTTRDGQLKGKLGYMAPEQIGGLATRATDVHAASVVLWEMLTGRRLFHAESEVQTFSNILMGTRLVPPSAFAPAVSPELNRVVLRGLQPNPADRYPSAREMARALQKATAIASPSDVGDWVQALAGPNIQMRARKIAAIESAAALATPFPMAVDAGPHSHPPVTGEGSRSQRALPRASSLVFPIGVAGLGAFALLGALVWAATPRRTTAPLHTAARPSSAVASAVDASLPERTPASTLAPQAPEVVRVPAVSTPVRDVSALPMARGNPHLAMPPAPGAGAPAPAASPHPASGAAGNDFSHVMDSRK